MQSERQKWNEKYSNQSFSNDPAPIVKKYAALAPEGRALDLAAGSGRNAIYLAQKGFSVDALDVSDVALKRISGRHPNVQPVCIDIDTFDIPAERYSLIVNIRFLSRRLFPYIQEGLIAGGILIFETYLDGPVKAPDGPTCRDYLLRKNELLHAFLSLQVLFYEEKRHRRHGETRQMASLVARRPA